MIRGSTIKQLKTSEVSIRVFDRHLPFSPHQLFNKKKWCFNSETKSLKHTGQSSEADYLVNHFHPFGQVVKGLQLGDVINQHNSLGTSVVG